MKLGFSIIICLLLCSCKSTQPVQRAAARPMTMVQAAEADSLAMSEAATAGPAGVIQSDTGFTWILPRTNRYFWVETKDVLQNTVIRYLHDREVYGDSLVIWPGRIDAEHHPELPETLNPAAFFRTRYTTNTP